MTTLHPFGPFIKSGKIEAELRWTDAAVLELSFSWPKDWTMRGLPASSATSLAASMKGPAEKRTDELWKTTCCEAFLKIEGQTAYYEINLSPCGGWNAYAFDSCRKPAPPRAAEGWKLLQIKYSPGSLFATFQTGIPSGTSLQVGLSAVTEFDVGESVYWALKHAGTKPDFHDVRSFILKKVSR